MKFKTVATGMAVLLLLSMGWRHKDAKWVQHLLPSNPNQTHPVIVFDNDVPSASRSQTPPSVSPRVAGVHKCRRGEQVIYTDGECPTGSREFAVNGGAVTVIPGSSSLRVPKLPELPDNHLPHARDLIRADENGQTRLRDQAMERVINR